MAKFDKAIDRNGRELNHIYKIEQKQNVATHTAFRGRFQAGF